MSKVLRYVLPAYQRCTSLTVALSAVPSYQIGSESMDTTSKGYKQIGDITSYCFTLSGAKGLDRSGS